MTNESDIKEALKEVNQNMLWNKKKIDIDNIVESLLLFFKNYFSNISCDVTCKIKNLKNISEDDKYKEIINRLVNAFFNMIENKIKETTLNKFNTIKEKVPTLSDNECSKELSPIANMISNELSDYYLQNASNLVDELNKNPSNI